MGGSEGGGTQEGITRGSRTRVAQRPGKKGEMPRCRSACRAKEVNKAPCRRNMDGCIVRAALTVSKRLIFSHEAPVDGGGSGDRSHFDAWGKRRRGEAPHGTRTRTTWTAFPALFPLRQASWPTRRRSQCVLCKCVLCRESRPRVFEEPATREVVFTLELAPEWLTNPRCP
jgi:hypothetical protein